MSNHMTPLPALIHINQDGIVGDEKGFPLPRTEVFAILDAVTRRYRDITPEEIRQMFRDHAQEHFPGMVDQLGIDETDFS